MMVGEGDRAPDFALPGDHGATVRLSELKGRPVVLYFYPKDDTSGCTVEACEFRDAMPRFESLDALVFGISPDPVESHQRFSGKFDLNFPLLADEDRAVAEAYGVWREKSMYGKTYMGIERSTFLVDEEGVIRRAWRKVIPRGHAAEVAAALSD
jgi:peroxiredoxin Q/BCP